jgi:hypothetical protein
MEGSNMTPTTKGGVARLKLLNAFTTTCRLPHTPTRTQNQRNAPSTTLQRSTREYILSNTQGPKPISIVVALCAGQLCLWTG